MTTSLIIMMMHGVLGRESITNPSHMHCGLQRRCTNLNLTTKQAATVNTSCVYKRNTRKQDRKHRKLKPFLGSWGVPAGREMCKVGPQRLGTIIFSSAVAEVKVSNGREQGKVVLQRCGSIGADIVAVEAKMLEGREMEQVRNH